MEQTLKGPRGVPSWDMGDHSGEASDRNFNCFTHPTSEEEAWATGECRRWRIEPWGSNPMYHMQGRGCHFFCLKTIS